MGRPPSSTPCPYTARFRSSAVCPSACEPAHPGRDLHSRGRDLPPWLSGHAGVHGERLGHDLIHVVVLVSAEPAEELHLGGRIDRKSTRLNSSHANISYAVF